MDYLFKRAMLKIKDTYYVGSDVVLYGLNGVPDKTPGKVEFIDDFGFLFVETPEGFCNVTLTPADENTRFIKE